MGVCLDGAVQQETRAGGFDTVATFEFNKDYALQGALADAKGNAAPDKWCPAEGDSLQIFEVSELPPATGVYDEEETAIGFGPRYEALLGACRVLTAHGVKIRVVFWRL